ncbi:MAG TPA: tetratricopeptide repeat protein [Gaiellaceae bacterium]|nr:tetratricopeptide repeat protein [Gaiellaceae bacterium]
MSAPDRRHDLPSGTVTLLFADVEGSTKLLSALGERFGPARARMRELVREAASSHGGAEVDWAGDGVFLAFAGAHDGIAAATQIQRSLAAEPWPDDAAHRLRIGLHTGEPELEHEGYVGMDVVIASRICAAAHGEQVVVSRATQDVAGDEPLPGASFRPLGRHRLKDVPAATQLFQLFAPGLREDFPPLTTLSANSLPALHHRLVGRADALARVEGLLSDGARLVTITGPGGAGKSRLALEVAAGAAIERPVHLVGLAPIAEPDLVPSAIARAIGVRESGGETPLAAVADRLNGTGALLYLDNLEHLAPSAVHVAELLDRAPDLQILATSRLPLNLSTERVAPLDPLTLEDATTLFVELAGARGVVLQPDALESVREICRRLDGLPLAIELVAARLVVLPPAEIVRALGEGLALSMEGPIDLPERQRTLRAAIDWSYLRLTETQRSLHGCLAVFSASAGLSDARAGVGSTDTFLADLEALVGWSLVRSEASDGEVRLSMLETVREHALLRLREEGVQSALSRRHAKHFLEVALRAESELAGADQAAWLDRLERDLDNFRAAIEWLLSSGQVEEALRATAALSRFWRGHGHMTEARRLLAHGLELGAGVPSDVRADALWAAARQAAAQSDWSSAVGLLEEALPLFRADGRGRQVVFTLSELAFLALRLDALERAATLAEESVDAARPLADPRATSAALLTLGEIRSSEGRHESALEHIEESLELRRGLGDALLVTDAVHNLGWVAFLAGDYARARAAFDESLSGAREIGDAPHTAEALRMLGELDLFEGDLDTAEERIRESLVICTEMESDLDRASSLTALGGVEAVRGRPEEAARLFAEALELRRGSPPEAPERVILDRFYASRSDESIAPITK